MARSEATLAAHEPRVGVGGGGVAADQAVPIRGSTRRPAAVRSGDAVDILQRVLEIELLGLLTAGLARRATRSSAVELGRYRTP